MDLVSGVVVYILLWWWMLFMTLPFGARPPEQVETGHDAGAPRNPMLKKKLIATTVLAAVVWVILDLLISSDLFSFREFIQDW